MAYDEVLADRIRSLVEGEPRLSEQRMFGGLAFLVGGHMAVAASGESGLMVRCDLEETATLLAEPGGEPMVMRGKQMRGWLRVAPDAVGDDEQLQVWVDRGVSYARSLPPKTKAR